MTTINLSVYNDAFIEALDQQLSVYTTIGGKNESPMWFQFNSYEGGKLNFRSSQVDYMFFSLPIAEEHKNMHFNFHITYAYFKELKYKHIQDNWPTVYYELRPNEKSIEVVKPAIVEPIETESTVSSYEQQAIDFLQSTSTEFTSEFVKFDFHFPGDKQKRNIFKITLKNAAHKYSFEFGSSLSDSLKNASDTFIEPEIDFYAGLKYKGLKYEYLSYSAKIKVVDLKNAPTFNDCKLLIDRRKAESIYNEFVKSNTTKYTHLNIVKFNEWFEMIVQSLVRKTTGLANKNWGEGIQNENIIHPTAYDVLACLTKYEVGTFEDFCSEYGYDSDSRKAYKTYKAVLKEWKNVERLFTADQLEQLIEIN